MLRLVTAFTFMLSLAPSAFAIDGDVMLTISVLKQDDNRVQLEIRTNLPAGTNLVLTVEEQMEGGFLEQSKCIVSDDGIFESETFGVKARLKDGLYFARASMPIPQVQPDHVKLIIGPNGENLKGSLVENGSFGITVSQSKAFSIGVNADEAQAARQNEADAASAALKRKTCVLLQELLTFKDEPELKEYGFASGGPYRKWFESVDALRSSTPRGARHPIPFKVRCAPNDLLVIGLDFMQQGDTDFTRERLPELKSWIGYEDFLKSDVTTRTSKPKSRTWHDVTGKFRVDATLVKKTRTHVSLRRSDGKVIHVPIEKLSAADREYASRQ
jgi:hypothetical protein